MSKTDTGGTAYPSTWGQAPPDGGLQIGSEGGMTLLDRFAIAYEGDTVYFSSDETLAAYMDGEVEPDDPLASIDYHLRALSRLSYGYAAAMIAEKRRREAGEDA